MMPDKIGIIGNTQGVNASNSPAPKKKLTINPKLPPLNKFSIRVVSDGVVLPEADTESSAALPAFKASSVLACWSTVPPLPGATDCRTGNTSRLS